MVGITTDDIACIVQGTRGHSFAEIRNLFMLSAIYVEEEDIWLKVFAENRPSSHRRMTKVRS